eukprot:190539_1
MKMLLSKWYLLMTICLVMVAHIFNRNLLVPLQDPLIDYYNINNLQYNLLQSLYSWPNAIMAVFNGVLVDKIGSNKMFTISYIILMLGAAIMVVSSLYKNYLLLCVSRCLIGIANESLSIIFKVLLMDTFASHEYGLVMGIFISIVPLSGAVNLMTTFQIYSWTNSITKTLLIPLFLNPILSIPLFTHLIANYYHTKKTTKQNEQNENELTELISESESNKKSKFQFSDFKQLPPMYWAIIISTCVFSVSYHSWNNIKVSFIHHMYGYSYSISSTIGTINSWCSIGTVLFFGYVTDKYGIKCKLMVFSSFILFTAQYMLGFVHIDIWITSLTLILVAIGYGGFYTAAWPGIAILVTNKMLGTAYGILASFRFSCMAVGYIIVGALTKESDGEGKYTNVQYFGMSTAALAGIVSMILLKLDYNTASMLEKSIKSEHVTNKSSVDTTPHKPSLIQMSIDA